MDAWGLARLDRVICIARAYQTRLAAARRTGGPAALRALGIDLLERVPEPRAPSEARPDRRVRRPHRAAQEPGRRRRGVRPGAPDLARSRPRARRPGRRPRLRRCGAAGHRRRRARRRRPPDRSGAGHRAVRPPLVRVRLGVARRRAGPRGARSDGAGRAGGGGVDARHRGLSRRGDGRGGGPPRRRRRWPAASARCWRGPGRR